MLTAQALSDSTSLGPVHLRVTNADKTAQLWTQVVGMQIVARGKGRLDLGLEGDTLITLHNDASAPAQGRAAGLFHLALELPSRLELARATRRLLDVGYPCAGQDHLVNESVYFSDRDGINFELSVSTPERARIVIVDGHPYFQTQDGVSHSGIAPLDMRRLLNEAAEHGPGSGTLPPGTMVGHLHMRSNTPEATMRFYTERIGFKPHIASAAFGMFDGGTAARPHIVAFNNWGGRNLPKPLRSSAGLRSFTIELPAAELDALGPALAATTTTTWDGTSLAFSDPDGNGVSLRPVQRSQQNN